MALLQRPIELLVLKTMGGLFSISLHCPVKRSLQETLLPPSTPHDIDVGCALKSVAQTGRPQDPNSQRQRRALLVALRMAEEPLAKHQQAPKVNPNHSRASVPQWLIASTHLRVPSFCLHDFIVPAKVLMLLLITTTGFMKQSSER